MFNLFRSKPSESAPAAPVAEKNSLPDENGRIRYSGIAPKERWDQIEYAFTSGGRNYFKFSNEVNIPFQRAIAARDILTEELWQINPKMLIAWNEGLIKVITDDKKKPDKKLFEIGVLAHRLKEQLELSHSLTRMMKLASVVYFDEYENPLDYQYPYNQEKIKFWMGNNDVQDFFLNLPEYALMPSGRELVQNFPTYLQAETMQSLNTLKHIIGTMSLDNTEPDLMKDILLQMETLENLNSWSKGQFTNTTSTTTNG